MEYFDKVDPKYYESISDYKNTLLKTNSSFDGCFDLQKYNDIKAWHDYTKLFEKVDTLPDGFSLGFQYLYIDNDEVIGMLNFRPQALNHDYLKKYGGHIGYSVKPDKRNNGVATRMLKQFLLICKNEYKLDKVLVTCYKDNRTSKKVILNNGGIFESYISEPNESKILERYWIKL